MFSIFFKFFNVDFETIECKYNNISNFTIDSLFITNNIHFALGGRLSTEASHRNASAITSRTVPRFCDNEVSIFGRFFDHNEIANASRSLLRNGTLIECRPERKRECWAVAPLAHNKSVLPATLFLFTYFASEMMQMLWINGPRFVMV